MQQSSYAANANYLTDGKFYEISDLSELRTQ